MTWIVLAVMAGVAATALVLGSASVAIATGPRAQVARLGTAPADRQIELVLPLVVDNVGLARFAQAVSTPHSPDYGQYETITTLARRFGASPRERDRVVRYLRAVGARSVKIDRTGMLAEATMGAGLAERVFDTPLARFRARDGVQFIAPAATASAASASTRLPASLRGLVSGVVGLDTQPVVQPPNLLSAPAGVSVAGRGVAHAAQAQPATLLPNTGTPIGCAAGAGAGSAAHGTPGFTPNEYLGAFDYSPLQQSGYLGQGERIALIETDGFKYSDLQNFARCFGLDIPALATFYVGSKKALPPGDETTLDLQVMTAAAPKLNKIEVVENNGDAAEVLKSLALPLVLPGQKPQVISMSLGLCEQLQFAASGLSGIEAGERELELAAATGISYLVASGDQGSAACLGRNGVSVDQLAVNYPASSPYVTAVGGTNIDLSAGNTIQDEYVWNDTDQVPGAAGGGGFSGLFPRPSYQNGVVGLNARALPDVSGLADLVPGYSIYCTAKVADCQGAGHPWLAIGGTSAATPLLAGGVALVDQYLHKNKKEFLGFLNPLLYALGKSSSASDIFFDVTEIGNDVGPYISGGNGAPLGCCTAGPGYDEASGWGSVELAKLGQAALQLLPTVPNVSLAVPRPQSPVRKHALIAKVSCSAACYIAALDVVRIGKSSFTDQSKIYHLRKRGAKSIPVKFSAKQEQELRSALAHRRKVTAEAFGASLDAGGNLLNLTAGKLLTVKG